MTENRAPSRARVWATRTLMVIGGMTIFFLLFLLILPLLFLGREPLPNRLILELDLEGGLIEYVPPDPLNALVGRNALTVRDAVEALERARTDDRVRGVIARLGSGNLAMPHAEELRGAIRKFRESGKPAIVFAESFGEFGSGRTDYYLASAFDEIHLQPSGDVGLTGLIAETPFLGQMLESVGIEPRLGHRYEYKDAVNTLTEERMTEPQREATTRVLTSMYENLIAGIASGRRLPPDEVRRLIDNGPYMSHEALEAGLVDQLSYRDQVYDSFREEVGGGEYMPVRLYLERAGRPHTRGPQIALIYGTGTIQTGFSQLDPLVGGNVMGSETITRAFREATESDAIRAIIFRVDSPGGSYVASDAIWRETVRAREAGKPVIVSMGNVAGSGGYFVAMGADHIIAHPSTITGSIGVYGGKVLVDDLSGKLGVTWDDVRVGGNATMYSIVEDYSPEEWAKVEASLDRIYEDFTGKVAEGRGLSRDSVHAIARGRIWTGADAMRLGLVDELGGFDTALLRAKEAAGIPADQPITLRVFPRERTLLEMLLEPERGPSYPGALGALGRLLRLAGEVVGYLRAVGLYPDPGVLTMPIVPQVR